MIWLAVVALAIFTSSLSQFPQVKPNFVAVKTFKFLFVYEIMTLWLS